MELGCIITPNQMKAENNDLKQTKVQTKWLCEGDIGGVLNTAIPQKKNLANTAIPQKNLSNTATPQYRVENSM